jgi:hypothetical protein
MQLSGVFDQQTGQQAGMKHSPQSGRYSMRTLVQVALTVTVEPPWASERSICSTTIQQPSIVKDSR